MIDERIILTQIRDALEYATNNYTYGVDLKESILAIARTIPVLEPRQEKNDESI